MIRKQVYITPEQQRKLRTLAREKGCSEAEIVRGALDCLPDLDRLSADTDPAVRLLYAEGLLVLPHDDEEPLSDEEMEQMEREFEEFLASQSRPINLTEAVLQERVEGW